MTHKDLLKIYVQKPTDFKPYGKRIRNVTADCSCGCKYFLPLEGGLGFDWGVCAHAAGPRSGLLTFEHQGCKEFKADPEEDVDDENAN